MAISGTDISFRLSTTSGSSGNSTSQTNVNQSLGKYLSTTNISSGPLNNLFDNISGISNASSGTDYRCFFVYNSNTVDTLYDSVIWINSQVSGGASIQIGLDPSGNKIHNSVSPQAVSISTESNAPSGVSFSTPDSEANSLSVGNLSPSYCRAVWVKRSANNNTPINNDGVHFFLTGNASSGAQSMEDALSYAVKVTNSAELLSAIAIQPSAIAMMTGIYNTGSGEVTILWSCDIRGGYNSNWQRSTTLPSPKAVFNSTTAVISLPQRLKNFLDTGLNETVIIRSGWDTSVGENVWYQLNGRCDRLTFIGTKYSAADQPVVLRGGDRQTTYYKDVMTVQRYNSSHSYVGFNIMGGESAIAEDCIFYCPFVGRAGNCRPQFLIGSDDSPQAEKYDQNVTLKNCTILMPINGGYHRLNFICGAVTLSGVQFFSPRYESYWNSANMRNVGFVTDDYAFVPYDSHTTNMNLPAGPDVNWDTIIRDCEFVMGFYVRGNAIRRRTLLMNNNTFYLDYGFYGSGRALWADRGINFGSSNTIYAGNTGNFFPSSGTQFQSTPAKELCSSGKYVWSTTDEESVAARPVCSGTVDGIILSPNMIQRTYITPTYEGISITYDELITLLQASGEIQCVNQFESHYPALSGWI